MRIMIFLFVLFLMACSCPKEKKQVFSFYPPSMDSTESKFLLSELDKTAQLFNVPVLYKGVDSFELRITRYSAFEWSSNFVDFTVERNGWKGYHYDAYSMPFSLPDGAIVRHDDYRGVGDSVFLVKKMVPLCGWVKFIDTLMSYRPDTLPTQHLIKNFISKGYLDGYGYNIEVATAHSYRFLNYYMPDLYQYNECKAISSIISLMQRQFADSYYWPPKQK